MVGIHLFNDYSHYSDVQAIPVILEFDDIEQAYDLISRATTQGKFVLVFKQEIKTID